MMLNSRRVNSLKGALRAQLDTALQARGRADDHSVHAVRQQLKRARATLRLMRAAIGKAQFRSANHRLRDAARSLRSSRDSAALLKALDKIARPGEKNGMKALTDQVREQLRQVHGSAHEQLNHRNGRVDAERIRRVSEQLTEVPMRRSDARSARCGIKQSYKDGCRAFALARLDPSAVLLHEWRKQAKYLANELELARGLLDLGFRKTHRRALKLASMLGDDHDLASLRDTLSELQPSFSAPGPVRRLKKLKQRIDHRRRKLQAKAYRRGQKLYGRPVHKVGALLKQHLR